MNIVVTGAAGMVGQNLVPLLVKKGHRVIALDKNKHNLDLLKELNPKIEEHCADLAKKGPWMELFKNAEAVVDLKAQIASREKEAFDKNNVEAQKKIIYACKRYGVKHLIHTSSSVVISVAKDNYTETKRKCEQLVIASGIPHTTLRPTLMYGCFDVKHLDWIAKIMEKTPLLPIPGSGKFARQPLYALDFCKIILNCLETGPRNKVYNITGLEKIEFKEVLKMIAKGKKLNTLIMPCPLPLFRLMLNTYAFALRKPTITPEQLTALMGGDIFPVDPWTKTFNVKYTKFKVGLKEIYASPNYAYRARMISPN